MIFVFLSLVFASTYFPSFSNAMNLHRISHNNTVYSPTPNILSTVHSISIDIQDGDTIQVQEVFVVKNIASENISQINFWLNYSIFTLVIKDAEGILLFDWTPISNTTHFISVHLREPLRPNEKTFFVCEYTLSNVIPLVSNSEELSYYSFEFSPSNSFQTEELSISVTLPSRSFLHEEEEIKALFPENAEQSLSDNRIVVFWQFFNVSAYDDLLILIRFDPPLVEEAQEGPFSSFFNIFIFGFAIGLFLGVSGTFWLIKYKERQAKREIGLSLLNDNQLELIKLIYEHGGKISQRDLCDLTGFSKSKISRNLVPLEERGLITREKWGRTYVVYLTETGEQVIEE